MKTFFCVIISSSLLLCLGASLSAQEGNHCSNYQENKYSLYGRAVESLYSGQTRTNYENRIVVTTNIYCFAKEQVGHALFDTLRDHSKAKDFSACFISADGALYMYVHEEIYKEPLTGQDVRGLADRNLYGVLLNAGKTIYLYGTPHNLITPNGKKYKKEYIIGNAHFNIPSFSLGCHVFLINGDSVELIDYIPNE